MSDQEGGEQRVRPIPPHEPSEPRTRPFAVGVAVVAVTVTAALVFVLASDGGLGSGSSSTATTLAAPVTSTATSVAPATTNPPATSTTGTSTTSTSTTSTTIPEVADPPSGPLFGEPGDVVLLFDDGGEGVVAIDPDNRIGSRTVLEGHRGGDPPYRIARSGDSIIVGWSSIHATNIPTGTSTELGRATIFVPAAEPDRVWLIRWAGAMGQGSVTAWQVDTAGRSITEPTMIDFEEPVFPVVGIPGGLAVETGEGIRLWYPDGSDSVDLGPGSVLTAGGDQLAYCATPCLEVRVLNLSTGESQSVYSDQSYSTFNFGGPSARFSPGGEYLAVTTNRAVVVFNTVIGATTTVTNQLRSDENPHLYVAWAPDGRQLFAATYSYGQARLTLARYDLKSGNVDIARLPFGGTIDFVVLDRSEAARFISDDEQAPTACLHKPQPIGREGICGFRF